MARVTIKDQRQAVRQLMDMQLEEPKDGSRRSSSSSNSSTVSSHQTVGSISSRGSHRRTLSIFGGLGGGSGLSQGGTGAKSSVYVPPVSNTSLRKKSARGANVAQHHLEASSNRNEEDGDHEHVHNAL